MSRAQTFLKDYISTAKTIITQPSSFFRDMPVEGGFRDPLSFAVLTVFIISLLYAPIMLISWAPLFSEGFSLIYIIIGLVAAFLYFFFVMLISIPINGIIYHILVKIFGARGSLEATIRVFCYYLAVTLVFVPMVLVFVLFFYLAETAGWEGIWIVILSIGLLLGMIAPILYSYYVLFVGFKVVHSLSMIRIILALVVIPMILGMLLVAALIGLILIASFSTDSMYSDQSPLVYSEEHYTSLPFGYIPVVYGSAPVIDGRYSFNEDTWYETEYINFERYKIPGDPNSEVIYYSMAAKHDRENLYILIRWDGDPTWQSSLDLRFEQDGDFHDQDLGTGVIDYKMNSIKDPSSLVDSHYMGEDSEAQNGTVKGDYTRGEWAVEWVIPLQGTDPGDINIENFPTTLGFIVIDWGSGVDTVLWPPGADPYEPETWGNLELESY
ncbi:MAG: YIP1 family protein [ANME-2 cluster archaeon]|jgi:hypothetical protein|nr:YIP1 family protein [ANME-2 cluster archaeon]